MKKWFLLMLIVLLATGASFAQMPEEVKREMVAAALGGDGIAVNKVRHRPHLLIFFLYP